MYNVDNLHQQTIYDRKSMLSWEDIHGFDDIDESLSNECNRLFAIQCADAENIYNSFIKHNYWTPQQARVIIPNCIKTEIIVTGNVREWRNCFKLRTDKAAHPQMREIMVPLIMKLSEDIPELWNDIIIQNDLLTYRPAYELCG